MVDDWDPDGKPGSHCCVVLICRLGGGPWSLCNGGKDGRFGGNGCPGGFCGGGRKFAIDPRGVGVRVLGGVRVCFAGGVGVRDGGLGGVGG